MVDSQHSRDETFESAARTLDTLRLVQIREITIKSAIYIATTRQGRSRVFSTLVGKGHAPATNSTGICRICSHRGTAPLSAIANPKTLMTINGAAWRRARAYMRSRYGRTWRWHDLRGAFITSVALNSGGILAQTLARHSDFATTQLYIEVADEMRRLAAARISDRAQDFAANENRRQDPQTAKFAPKPGRRKALK